MTRLKSLRTLTGEAFEAENKSYFQNDSPLEKPNLNRYTRENKERIQQLSICENLIDKKQLAKNLSISLSYVDKLMAKDELPYFKIGRAVRYRFSEVVTFLERRKRL